MQYSLRYTLLFAGAVCIVCSVLVSGAAVLLKQRQEENKVLDRQLKVLDVAGLLPEGKISRDRVQELFRENIRAQVVDLSTGQVDESIEPSTFDQRAAAADPATSMPAPKNEAQVQRIPNHALIYKVVEGDQIRSLILPVEGKGLWSTLYGFLALAVDANTVVGLTFYQHAETPGLGGEVDNPRWKQRWQGRKVYNDQWEPALQVVKGAAPEPSVAPHKVDGLSGATLTARGVTNLIAFWMGDNGFGPYLKNFRQTRS